MLSCVSGAWSFSLVCVVSLYDWPTVLHSAIEGHSGCFLLRVSLHGASGTFMSTSLGGRGLISLRHMPTVEFVCLALGDAGSAKRFLDAAPAYTSVAGEKRPLLVSCQPSLLSVWRSGGCAGCPALDSPHPAGFDAHDLFELPLVSGPPGL